MSTVRGVLEKAYQNERGYWSINVNNQWYGTYKDDYTSLEGNEVEFEATKKGQYWNASKVKPAATTNGAAGKAVPAQVQSAGDRQSSIVLQSSYKTAAEVLNGLIIGDKVALGAKGAAFDNAVGLLDQLALHIYHNCIDPTDFVAEGENPAPPADEGFDPVKA